VELQPTLIATFGRTRILATIVSLTPPWLLSGDALVVPADSTGGLHGNLAKAIREVLGGRWEFIQAAVDDKLGRGGFGPKNPVIVPVNEPNVIMSKYMIIATTFSGTEAQPDIATVAILRLLKSYPVRTLILPLLGSGAGGENSVRTAERMFAALKEEAAESGIESVTLTTLSQESFGRLSYLGAEASRLQAENQKDAGLKPVATVVSDFLRALKMTLDKEALRVMLMAGNLGPQRNPDNHLVTTSLLLFALIEANWIVTPDRALGRVSELFLRQVRAASRYPRVRKAYFDGRRPRVSFEATTRSVERISENASLLLESACRVASQHGYTSLSPDAIVAALVTLKEGRATTHLRNIGVDMAPIRTLLDRVDREAAAENVLQETFPSDVGSETSQGVNVDVSSEDLLADSQDEPVGDSIASENSQVVPDQRVDFLAPRVAGYASDSVPERDQALPCELDIRADVSTLCSVLLATEVKPPLAVGLFGDWGAGKSYFMEAMYRYIEDLAERARSAERTAYHGSVVQIRFNAWHYLDANLWASLVSHIFDELGEKICPKEKPEETKRRLLLQLDSAKQIRKEAAQERELAVSEMQTAEVRLDEATTNRRKKEVELADLHPSDLLQLIGEEDRTKIKADLAKTLDGLGIPGALSNMSDVEDAYRRAASLAGRTQAVVLSFGRANNKVLITGLVMFTFVAVPLVGWASHTILRAPWIAGVSAVFGDIAMALGALAVGLKKHLGTASSLLAKVEENRDKAVKLIREKQSQQSTEELRLQGELEGLLTKEAAARKSLEEADCKVREIQRKLDEINAGRSLSKFILERVQAEDYRRHLGIVSTIRKDFERLGVLLKEGQSGLDKVSRLILYVDDLDRCPTEKVVEVLQAVHLLLAMPIFVAVVGVDLRWLLHSLDQQYTAFQKARRARPEGLTSPQDYLEKIFQIPFNLRPMETAGYEKLVAFLLPETIEAAPPSIIDKGTMERPAPSAEALLQGSSVDITATESPVQQDSLRESSAEQAREPDLNPASLRIQSWERDFAQGLFSFVPTPRAAKRFANVYRLLKAPQAGDALASFEGTKAQPGDFQAAMLLLAVVIGMPKKADQLFGGILEGSVAGVPWRKVFERNLHPNTDQAKALSTATLGDDLRPFVSWVPQVSRFTFETAKAGRGWTSNTTHAVPESALPGHIENYLDQEWGF